MWCLRTPVLVCNRITSNALSLLVGNLAIVTAERTNIIAGGEGGGAQRNTKYRNENAGIQVMRRGRGVSTSLPAMSTSQRGGHSAICSTRRLDIAPRPRLRGSAVDGDDLDWGGVWVAWGRVCVIPAASSSRASRHLLLLHLRRRVSLCCAVPAASLSRASRWIICRNLFVRRVGLRGSRSGAAKSLSRRSGEVVHHHLLVRWVGLRGSRGGPAKSRSRWSGEVVHHHLLVRRVGLRGRRRRLLVRRDIRHTRDRMTRGRRR